jgi:non-homologous end joining protein Ku
MPRPVWSGAISFGLVTIPIKVLPATESHSISFHQVHEKDGGRIRYQKVCTLDDKVLDQSEIGRTRSSRSRTPIWARCRCRPRRHLTLLCRQVRPREW